MSESPNYFAVLPAEIRYDKNLSPLEKLLFAEVTALSNKEGYCWASNAYFAELYDRTPKYISDVLNKLAKAGYLEIEIGEDHSSRKIRIGVAINPEGVPEKSGGGVRKNPEHNNIINIKSNNITNKPQSSIDVDLTNLLYQLMVENNPGMKRRPTPSEYDQMRLLRKKDERNEALIELVIRWSQRHDFWHSNILSVKKLRQKFDQLLLQAKSDHDKKQNKVAVI